MPHRWVSFRSASTAFPPETDAGHVYDTLEAASSRLVPVQHAILSAVLAKPRTGLPGQGFYDMFRVHRSADYARIAGHQTHPTRLTSLQMQEMADLERSRVHAFAQAANW